MIKINFTNFINDYINQYDLSYRKMGDLCNISHSEISRLANGKQPSIKTIEKISQGTSTPKNKLLKLAGYIEADKAEELPPGAISVSQDNTTLIPVVGTVACGEPLLAEENIVDYRLVLNKTINGGRYFFLQAQGDSMINAGITPHSYILVRQQQEVENGEIAVVAFMDSCDATVTVKRIYHTDGKLFLQPESPNPKHKVQIIDSGEVRIIGKVVGIQTDL